MTHYAGRTPADWDQSTWSTLESLFGDAWRMSPPDARDLARQMYVAGFLLGSSVVTGPLMARDLADVVCGICENTKHDGLRELIENAAAATEGDRDGLTDLAMALRDGSKVVLMAASGKIRSGTTAQHAFLNAKAQMLKLSRTSVEEAFGAD